MRIYPEAHGRHDLMNLDLAAGVAVLRQGHRLDAVEVDVFADQDGPKPLLRIVSTYLTPLTTTRLSAHAECDFTRIWLRAQWFP